MAVRVIITSKISGRIKEDIVTYKFFIGKDEYEIVESLTECDCQPTGLTMHTDCDCYEEWCEYDIEFEETNPYETLVDELKEDIFNNDIGGAIKTLRQYGITE